MLPNCEINIYKYEQFLYLVEKLRLKGRSNLRQTGLHQAYNPAPELVASPNLSSVDRICNHFKKLLSKQTAEIFSRKIRAKCLK